MHLRDRSARHRLRLEVFEHPADRSAEGALHLGHRKSGRKWRHLVLQLRQLVGDVGRQQIAAGREHLAELDEDRPERLEREAQPHRARLGEPAEEKGRIHGAPGSAARVERELVQSEAQGDPEDSGEAEKTGQGRVRFARGEAANLPERAPRGRGVRADVAQVAKARRHSRSLGLGMAYR